MNTKEIILNKLLDKYEKSKSYTETVNRKIAVKMSNIKEYKVEDYEQRELWNSVLLDLQQKELIGFKWEKFEVNNIIEEVWLIKENIPQVYEELGRLNPKKGYKIILGRIQNCKFSQEWLKNFQNDMIQYMTEKQKENALLPLEKSSEIIKALKEIDKMLIKSKNPMILKRVFSIKCYNDSKYFERNIEKNVTRILKKYLCLERLKEDEILSEVGIVKYPEIIEFCGDIKCIIKGREVKYSSITDGSYINGIAIENIDRVEIGCNINKIIFIENKANYINYIQSKKDNELVIYHGGFYSPIKGEFFRKIYNSSKNIECFHWSDIDIGGFEIFTRLRDNIIPELKPIKMDIDTLLEYKNRAILFDTGYHDELTKLKADKKFEIFWDVIDYMLENNVKLEQEAIIE